MIRQIGWDQITQIPKSVVTVGTFDGVHKGHQALVAYLNKRAGRRKAQSVVVTFDPHPKQVVTGNSVAMISTLEERAEALEKAGLDRLVVIPFTKEFSQIPSDEFVRDILVNKIGMLEMVIGYDHGFGRDREGNAETLIKLGQKLSFNVDVVSAQDVEDIVVSSTKIRSYLSETGEVQKVVSLLGRPYPLSGIVQHGEGRGRQIGFPTANIEIDHPQKVVPKEGVYAVRVLMSDGTKQPGMMNIGRRPTFGPNGARTLEVHLINYQANLYGQTLQIDFISRLRDEIAFSGIDNLVIQLKKDRERCISILGVVS